MVQEYIYHEEGKGRKRAFIKSTAVKQSRQNIRENPMLMTLCARCAWQFYESPWHRIRREDPWQIELETCTYCNVRRGYDYIIYDYRKPVVKKRNTRVFSKVPG